MLLYPNISKQRNYNLTEKDCCFGSSDFRKRKSYNLNFSFFPSIPLISFQEERSWHNSLSSIILTNEHLQTKLKRCWICFLFSLQRQRNTFPSIQYLLIHESMHTLILNDIFVIDFRWIFFYYKIKHLLPPDFFPPLALSRVEYCSPFNSLRISLTSW